MAISGKKDEDRDGGSIKIDRSSVYHEARSFHTSPILPRKCRIILTKIALFLFSGEKFPQNEATGLFFGISQLFQNSDPSLRQMIYLVIKELAQSAEDVIMLTAIIMKDCQITSEVIYRANAIRALCRIVEPGTIPAIERIIKTAIVDRSPSVSSAALVTAYHLLPVARDVIRRWNNEIQDVVTGNKSGGYFSFSSTQLPPPTSFHSHYHAIGLLYKLRSQDRMAMVKMVQQYSAFGVVKSPAGTMLLVRLAAKTAGDDPSMRTPMMQLLLSWLQHKSEIVNFEAAKAICDFADAPDNSITQAIHTLQLFLTSPRSVTKFAAIRILHNFAAFKPDAVRTCNPDLETLVTNTNLSIATFAISTLLKTCNESSVDRIMKKITSFMSEISDDFKVTIVEAIRTLAIKFPSKHAGIFTLLTQTLREEGGYEFKRAVVESMFDLIKFVRDSKEDALSHLAEFIEDCEFTKLAVRILHLLGVEGPKAKTPTKYIRHIYNRVVLENSIVRAAAVTALGKFGVTKDPAVRKSVRVLLTRCLDDVDDEVRDRAAMNLKLMDEDEVTATAFIRNEPMFMLSELEQKLVFYVTSDGEETFVTPFDLSAIKTLTREELDASERTRKLTVATPTVKPTATKVTPSAEVNAANAAAATQRYSQEISKIPEMAAFGVLLNSSRVVELTEPDTEYVVTAAKHLFKEHVVLQFNVKNTMAKQVRLQNISIVSTVVESEDNDEPCPLEEEFLIPIASLETDEPGTAYVAFKNSSNSPFPTCTFSNNLKFTSREIDPTTQELDSNAYDDDYEIEGLHLSGSDYVIPVFNADWDAAWAAAAGGEEVIESFELGGPKSLEDAVTQLVTELNLQPLDGSDMINNPASHVLKLYGQTATVSQAKSGANKGGSKVAARVQMAYRVKAGVTVKMTVRSEEEGVASLVMSVVV